jgi:hypothetical protein
MSTNWKIGVDWRRKGIVCWDAKPGDALNILPEPIGYTALAWRTNTATSIARQQQATNYGRNLFAVQSGTGVNNGFVLGQSDTLAVNTIVVSPSTIYSVTVRVKGISSYSGIPVILRVKDQTGATLVTSSSLILSADWQMLSANFTTGVSASHIMLEVIKNNNATDVLFHLAGVMLVTGNTIPSGYNTGNNVDLYDNITDLVTEAEWFLGFKEAYQDMPHASSLNLTLNNSDKRFSPDYTPGGGANPLQGYVRPLRPIYVLSDDGTTIRTQWSGWLESVEPASNQYGERIARLKASGPERFFSNVETAIEIQENKRTDEIIEVLLDEVPMPPRLVVSAIVGDATNPVGTATIPEVKIARDLQEGQTVLAIAADNWIRETPANDDSRTQTFNVYHAMKDMAGAERGRFFFNREGRAVFWNRHQLLKDKTVQATFDNSMTELEYTFAGLDEFMNDIRVTCHPRQISGNNNELLWLFDVENKDAIRLIGRRAEREVQFSFKNDSGRRIAGRDVHIGSVTFGPYEYSGNYGNINSTHFIIDAKANGGTLLIRGNIGQVKDNFTKISVIEIRGQTITDYGQMEAVAEDQWSITRYGRRTLRLNLPAVDNLQDAQRVADFERYRRKEPSGKVASMTMLSQGKQGGNAHADQLAREIGDRIEVIEAQLGHTGDYFIIGEAQKLSENATLLETTWYLESAIEGNWAVVGDAKVYGDGTEDPEPYMPYIGYIVAY